MLICAEYIWLDGMMPQKIRSKTRVLNVPADFNPKKDMPDWGFDGSSTRQSKGGSSDLVLKPSHTCKDPIRGGDNLLVLCEVFNPDNTPHKTNHRAELRDLLFGETALAEKYSPWFGFEQEHTLFEGNRPLGWPERGYPAPQGPFYCGVGSDEAFGRDLVEEHLQACLDAELMIYGVNAEVMPGQWEFQIGYRNGNESADPLTVSDHVWLARWLLYRIGEKHGINATLNPKPVKGDWNGAGMHTNFSTQPMRVEGGDKHIAAAIEKLAAHHQEHIAVYGSGNDERLTGEYETAPIDKFISGVADRGASIRIPSHVAQQGFGYLEDRRPAANADPYVVCARMLKTVCL